MVALTGPAQSPSARQSHQRESLRKRAQRTMLHVVMIVVTIVYAIPIYWIISTSFKPEIDAFAIPPKWFFFQPTLDNYFSAFVGYGMLPNFINSIIVAIGSTTLSLVLGVPAAYALSRFNIQHREDLMFWFLSTRMAPPILVAVPFFLVSRQVGLYDTRTLLILINVLTSIAWVVFMMRSFFDDIPVEIDEAALVDGASWLETLWRVIIPVALPGIAATVVFVLILAWNEYFFALILTSVNAKTLPAAITSFLTVHGLLWGPMTAAGSVVALPVLIFTLWTQKYLIRGMTMGAVK